MSTLSKKEQQILDSHREIIWLKRQIEQYEKENTFQIQEIPEDTDSESIKEGIQTYRKHINAMRVQLGLATLRNKKRQEIAKAIDEHYFTTKALYPERTGHYELKSKKMTESQVNKRDDLVTEFMTLLNEFNQQESELTQLQGDIIKQHLMNRQIMDRITKLEQEQDMDLPDHSDDLHKALVSDLSPSSFPLT